MFYCGPIKIEKLNKCNLSNAGIAQLQIAEHKCCVLSHGNVTQPKYYMHTVQLPNVNECRDVGVFVDSHCNVKHHISHICRNVSILLMYLLS